MGHKKKLIRSGLGLSDCLRTQFKVQNHVLRTFSAWLAPASPSAALGAGGGFGAAGTAATGFPVLALLGALAMGFWSAASG